MFIYRDNNGRNQNRPRYAVLSERRGFVHSDEAAKLADSVSKGIKFTNIPIRI